MKKYISLMNPYSFYYLWDSEFKLYLEMMIQEITKNQDKFELIKTFNNTNNYLKSYIFLESKTSLIYIDFQINDYVLAIYNYLEITSDKKVILIIFNSSKGLNTTDDNIYHIYQSENNPPFLKLFLSKNFKEQCKSELKDIVNYLYNLDNNFYLSYFREEKLKHDINI